MTTRRASPRPPAETTHEFASRSVEETLALGERLGRALRPGDVVALHGELGSGKTTLIQGIARGMGLAPERVKSPTFVLVREYPGPVPLVHVDGYRLDVPEAALWFDTDLLCSRRKVTVVEWAERLAAVLPECALSLTLRHRSTNRRRIAARATAPRGEALLAAWREAATAATSGSDDVSGD